MKKNNKRIKKKCVVCGKNILIDTYGNGDCLYCGWYNNSIGEENLNKVIFPNLISLNKAKNLYKEKIPFTPSLNDFMDMLHFYGEVGFSYNGKDCGLFLIHAKNGDLSGIKFGWSPESIQNFKDKEDFIQNAKIGNEYVRDIWDKVENPCYL